MSGTSATPRSRLSPAALIGVLRRPDDPASEAGRAQLRNRAIALTALASACARGIQILTALVAVPLTLHYLGNERYGMWMTLSAFTALLSFTDFGIGNSVLTALAHRAGQDDHHGLRVQVSSAYGAMTGIAAIMLVLLAIVWPFVDWAGLFNAKSALARQEAGPAAAMFLAILALTTPVSLIARVQLGLQQGFRGNVWQSVASLAALGMLVVATRLEASLPWLVLALAGTPLVVSLVNTLHFFWKVRPDLRPAVRLFDGHAIRRLSVDGGMFLVLQVCAALLFQINAVIIAQVLGAAAVATYAVPERMFAIVGMILAFVLSPLWPAYGDAVSRGDIAWVRRTLRLSLVLGMTGAAIMSLALVVLGPTLLRLWVGNAVAVPFGLIAGFAVWKVFEAAANAMAMFLNGINALKIQLVLALVNVAVSLVLKVWWVKLFGLPGVMYATIVAYVVIALPPLAWVVRKSLAEVAARAAAAAPPH